MHVREIMKTNVFKIRIGTTFTNVARQLLEFVVSGAPVVDNADRLLGIISEKDLFRAIYPRYQDFYEAPEAFLDFQKLENEATSIKDAPVESFMSRRLITASPDTPILKIGAIMVATGIHRVPVVENGILVGMVSRGDIYRAILREYFDLWDIERKRLDQPNRQNQDKI